MIVGGGVSGLTAAYLLRQRDFLLLEKEPHWGGNAYLMDYQGAAYATGAAFLTSDESTYTFSKEIGLEPLPVDNWDGSIINGEFIPDTWGDGLDKLPYSADRSRRLQEIPQGNSGHRFFQTRNENFSTLLCPIS